MTVPVEKCRYTIAEYLAMEEKATDRHQFHDGEILAMLAGTYRRSRINPNLLGLSALAFAARPVNHLTATCAFGSPAGGRSYIPISAAYAVAAI